ncbi:MAG: DUF6516 family protein [Candidatus Hydrogenedentota bacterium]
MTELDNFLSRLNSVADHSEIVERQETLSKKVTTAKLRYHLIDGSYVDVFVNIILDKYYYHWQRADGKIYRINNYPPEGWHEHLDTEDNRHPIKRIEPEDFFYKIKSILERKNARRKKRGTEAQRHKGNRG